MWTRRNRTRYDRGKLRYPSDLTDDEWGLVEPLIPPGTARAVRFCRNGLSPPLASLAGLTAPSSRLSTIARAA